jgi:hypothetical protein
MEAALRGELERLQSAEFLYEVRLLPDAEYTFRYALGQDLAYGTHLQDRRWTPHRAVVAAVERLYVERLTEQIDRFVVSDGRTFHAYTLGAPSSGARACARSG